MEAGINSETMVYFTRSNTGTMTRLPICNHNQRIALEGMVDYMNMMSHFTGGQVRDRDPNNMVVIVPIHVCRLVSRYREIQAFVRTLFAVGRIRGSGEPSDSDPRRSDSSGTPVRARDKLTTNPVRLSIGAEVITPIRLNFEN